MKGFSALGIIGVLAIGGCAKPTVAELEKALDHFEPESLAAVYGDGRYSVYMDDRKRDLLAACLARKGKPGIQALIGLFGSESTIRASYNESFFGDGNYVIQGDMSGKRYKRHTYEVGDAARDAIVAIGPPAVPALSEALADSQQLVRQRAIEALATIGPPAASALPLLEKLAGTSKKDSGLAHDAIYKIRSKAGR
ncbi:MAG: HEAT repeat domain-containing protein [Isosphaerales bacterium]